MLALGPLSRQFTTPTVALFNRLPIELQAEIFIHCLPDYPQLLVDSDAPNVFLQVCRAWRNVAISTPRLWSAIAIDLGDGRLPFTRKQVLSPLSLWLSRSRSLPLFIEVTYRPTETYSQLTMETIAQEVTMCLLGVAHRWQRISAILPAQIVLPLTSGSSSYDFPLLRSINFEVKGQTGASPVPFDIRALGVDWAHLTVFNVWSEYENLLTLDQWAQLLTETTGLTHCRFNVKCVWAETHNDSSVLRVSPLGLRHLDIVFQGEADVHAPDHALAVFLEQLDFPTLKECHLSWQVRQQEVGSSNDIRTSLHGFLHSHRQSLETLSLGYFPLHENHLIESFRSLSYLTALTLKSSLEDSAPFPISDRTLQALTWPVSSRSKLLPWLRCLRIQCRGNTLSSQFLARFVESRRETSLHEIRFLLLTGSNETLAEEMKHYEEKDIKLTLDFVTI